MHPIIILFLLYIGLVSWFGVRLRHQAVSMRQYFLADRNIPWPAIMLSIVAAETSTLTIMSIPGLAYDTNFGFLQFAMGYIIGRFIISFVFLPRYFRGNILTVYEFVQQHFGKRLRLLIAGLFLFKRAAAEGVRAFAVALMMNLIFGVNDLTALTFILLLTSFYTFMKGMPIVIWTDAVQVIVYFCGAIIAFFSLLSVIPGDWHSIYNAAQATHKLQIFDTSLNFFKTYTVWSGIIGGTFFALGTHGADQVVVQRLLAAKNLRSSQIALLVSGFTVFIQFALFLLIGVMLWYFYSHTTPTMTFTRPDQIFPTFIKQQFSHGPLMIIIIAILCAAMANLSASLNALSSSTILDVYVHFFPAATEHQRMNMARLSTVFWTFVLFGLALLSRHSTRVLELGLTVLSVPLGSMLGIFLLGILRLHFHPRSVFVGVLSGLILNIYLWQFTKVPYTWYVLIGSLTTMTVSYLVNELFTADATKTESIQTS